MAPTSTARSCRPMAAGRLNEPREHPPGPAGSSAVSPTLHRFVHRPSGPDASPSPETHRERCRRPGGDGSWRTVAAVRYRLGAGAWTRRRRRLCGAARSRRQRRALECRPGTTGGLSGLPPTWIGVGSLDLFRDEDAEYAARLAGCGVPCQLEVIPGVFHGFDVLFPAKLVSADFLTEQVNALAAGFTPA